MHVFANILLAISSAFAYRVTYPGDSQGWNTTGPNVLTWQRVDTDPLNFTIVLENQSIQYSQILDSLVDGTLGSYVCTAPSGGWPSGSNFRVDLAQDAQHINSLLAQSDQFNITATSSGGSTTSGTSGASSGASSGSTQTGTSGATTTSSQTSTTPTGSSAASVGADTQTGLLTVVAVFTTFITAFF